MELGTNARVRIQGMFLKRVLRVGKGTSNQGVKREFSIFSDKIMRRIMIKYWLDIMKGSRGTLRAIYYEQQRQHAFGGYWLISLKRDLDGKGKGWVWERADSQTVRRKQV